MLLAAKGQRSRACFRLGYVTGLAHYLASLYWLLFIPFPAGAMAGWIALSAYLALYPATWVWLCWRLFPTGAADDQRRKNDGNFTGWRWTLPQVEPILSANWWRRSLWSMLCAAAWVAFEMVMARFLSGFPWNFLGVSQYQMLPLIQIASAAGVYGVSFLVVWFSVSLALVILRLVQEPGNRWGWLAELRLALLCLVAVAGVGINKILTPRTSERELTLALIQPGIPQVLIWDHAQDSNRFNKILELSDAALRVKPEVLVWPEASMPNLSDENFRAITGLIASNKVWMVFGADDLEPRAGVAKPDDQEFYNAALLFNPEGKFVATYRKQRLVVFGEYVPLARWLPFLRSLIPVPGDFTPGKGPVPFEFTSLQAKCSVLICFEDVFPHLARHYVEDDTDFLLNLTNDGWFGESAAQWQQAANAVFRAVENGLPLVRCTNNGLTCWIDSRGRIREILGRETGDVYTAGFMTVAIPLLPAGRKREPTFYNRHGDWFGWGCVALSLIAIGRSFLVKGARKGVAA
jgi:apolipoprotein N-acyltransferase